MVSLMQNEDETDNWCITVAIRLVYTCTKGVQTYVYHFAFTIYLAYVNVDSFLSNLVHIHGDDAVFE